MTTEKIIPLELKSRCVMSNDELYEHIRLALERGLPLIGEHLPHDGVAVLVGSGPSVAGELESIKKHRENGDAIVAIKDAHDWLIDNGIVPDYAVAVDPQEHRWSCFKRKNAGVKYMIGSQCHPNMFDHLSDQQVFLWHLYVTEGQTYPPNSILVTGGTTSGLRAITLYYSMGFRRFHLYGYDSCLKEGELRIDGTGDKATVITLIVGGKRFETTPSMAAQACEFQNLFQIMPDMDIQSHGRGIITTILEERNRPAPAVSFVHGGDDSVASFRYRVKNTAMALGYGINDFRADTLIYAKPQVDELAAAIVHKSNGKRIIVDFCDDHFDQIHYHAFLRIADAVTCPTAWMYEIIHKHHHEVNAYVVPDGYLMPECEPHCNGTKLLWFGHAVNYAGIADLMPRLTDYDLHVVSNAEGAIPWSNEIMPREFARADIVLLPRTEQYKSANRAIEAIRQGCFVVAEHHPSLNDIPGIWKGDIIEGIQWASQNLSQANELTKLAQAYVRENFSQAHTANALRTVLAKFDSTLDVVTNTGTAG